jgi:hypothetical protein
MDLCDFRLLQTWRPKNFNHYILSDYIFLVGKHVMTKKFDQQACDNQKFQLPHVWWSIVAIEISKKIKISQLYH